tara:strand:- start:7860 stop:8972 length:1113 start_codon:yes stop_codon:yes gene_type:complete
MSIKIIKFFDKFLGNILCSILGNFTSSNSKILPPKNILIIQLWGVGESILTLPGISLFQEKYPTSKLTILTTNRNSDVYPKKFNQKILKLNPFSILSFIVNNLKHFDTVIDMEEYLNISAIISFFVGRQRIGYSHNSRSKLYTNKILYNSNQHTSKTFSDLFSPFQIKSNFNSLEPLEFSKKDKFHIDSILKNLKSKSIIGIAPGAAESAKSRMWPLDYYTSLTNQLLKQPNRIIIFVGTKEESDLINKILKKVNQKNKTINLAGKITLKEFFYLAKKFNLFIGNDAGAMHVSAAQGTKTIGLFGPNLPTRFSPFGQNNISIYKGEVCKYSPCINVHKGQVPDCLYSKTSKSYQKCMKNITVKDVLVNIP